MIDWKYPPEWPPMVDVDDEPLWISNRLVPTIRTSEPVLLAIRHPTSGHRRIMVGRVCRADGHPEPFERVYGRSIVAWAPVDWPQRSCTDRKSVT